ncbi:putative membrane protein [Streptomyces himastatinicus ATCC 53653]|uniref:Putative membrane protein n=1 Tax=Streptomyces himastatinicus ATCC 53653 TaxID=457427 RepID=D9W703_9ACTN|nr:putative membrane protein [Streptomyces himastatinicus ATCC 53653]
MCIIGRQRSPTSRKRRGSAVKKLLLVALAAIGGLLVYRQIQADRAEQDLWTEATDSVPAGSGV